MSNWFSITGVILFFGITACTGGNLTFHQTGRIGFINSAAQSNIFPVAVPGNAEFSINDEAPIIRNEDGIPIRQDKDSQAETIHFDGFNEE